MADSNPTKDLLALFNSRLSLSEKFSKKWKDNVKKWLKDYNIETLLESRFEGLDNQMQIPYIFSTIESGLPSIFETIPKLIMSQRGKKDREFTTFTNNVWEYLQGKIKLEEVIEEAGFNFLVTGHGDIKYGWTLETQDVEETQDQPLLNSDGSPVLDKQEQPVTQPLITKTKVPVKDLPFIKSYDYKHMEFSPESKFVLDDEENLIPYKFYKTSMTPEQIKEKYNKTPKTKTYLDLKEIDSQLTEDDGKDFVKTDLERTDVWEYYGTLPQTESLDNNWRSSKVYYSVFIKDAILKKPEELSKKPSLELGNYGSTTSFWRFGEPKVLRELEQDISLGRSRIADIRDKQGTKIAIPEGTEVDEAALKRAKDFVVMRFIGSTPPQYITPPPLPETILVALQQSRDDLQMASATLDISRGGDSNTVSTATGQKIFSNATEKRINRKKKKIGNLIKAIAKNLLILCAYNWDAEVFGKITDIDDPTALNQYIEQLKQLGEEFDIDIDLESINDNSETEAASAIALYREMKDDPIIKREEVVRYAIIRGFNIKDSDRFIKTQQEIQAEAANTPTPKTNVSVSVKADAGTPQGDEILVAEGLIKAQSQANSTNPDNILKSLEYLVTNQLITEQEASQIASKLAQVQPQQPNTANPTGQLDQTASDGEVGRPSTASPTDVVKNSMVGSDNTQIAAQNASGKQTGVAKGPQGLK